MSDNANPTRSTTRDGSFSMRSVPSSHELMLRHLKQLAAVFRATELPVA